MKAVIWSELSVLTCNLIMSQARLTYPVAKKFQNKKLLHVCVVAVGTRTQLLNDSQLLFQRCEQHRTIEHRHRSTSTSTVHKNASVCLMLHCTSVLHWTHVAVLNPEIVKYIPHDTKVAFFLINTFLQHQIDRCL